MKYRALLIIASVLVAGTAVAAGPHAKGGPPGPDIDKLAILLDLNDGQKQELDRIFTEQREAVEAKREAFRASGERPDRETVEASREAMRASTRAQLETVLTPAQLEKLDVLHEMRGDRREHHPGKHRRPDIDESNQESN